MLLRLYRLTDKLGVVLLKLITEAVQILLEGAHVLVSRSGAGLAGLAALLLGLLGAVARVLRQLFALLGRGFAWVLATLGLAARRTGNVAAKTVKTAAQTSTTAARTGMAQRAEAAAAREAIDVGMAEDPLLVRNRVQSVLLVLLGFALLGVILWATSGRGEQSNPNPVAVAANGSSDPISFAPDDPPTPTIVSIINTPVPTVTPIPRVLEIRGSIAYTARERGQTDIWVVNVGSTTPIRLTGDPEDERDPAWSPDGRRLAYASRKDGNWEIYVRDLAEGTESRLTYDLSFQGNPSFSPDGAFLVYESYQGNNLDLYIVPADGSEAPIRLTAHPTPDFDPVWSPDGRRIAFVSWRTGSQDIHIFSLDDPRDDAVMNVTNTPNRHEGYPAWSPDGELLAFSAVDEGLEKVFVKAADDPGSTAQVLERGRAPAWSPDGISLLFAVDSVDSTHLVASPFTEAGVATEIIPVLRGANTPAWTSAPLPATVVNSGGEPVPVPDELFIEQEVAFESDPPFRLDTLLSVEAPNAVLNDRVNDSFNALRERAIEVIGYDFLGELEDAFWRIDRPPQPGEERRNWHMTGRAFAINRNLIAGFPPPIEVVKEERGVNTYWRVFVRVSDSAQNGQLGEPLRQMPWDFASRNQGDVEAYDQGGRLRAEMPEGYYVDLTQLAADYGWEWMPAGRDWRANFNSINFWMFRKDGDLSWYEAMREIYTEAQLGGFAPTATPAPPVPATEAPSGA